jgi:hypothetical protein
MSEAVQTFLIAVGVIVGAYALVPFVFNLLQRWRVARRPCPRCGTYFGQRAASAAPPFWKRLSGVDLVVFETPRKYNGTFVMKCNSCGGEFIFGELGGFVEEFRESLRDELFGPDFDEHLRRLQG